MLSATHSSLLRWRGNRLHQVNRVTHEDHLLIGLLSIFSAQKMILAHSRQGKCGHLIPTADPHCVCFVCRTNPELPIKKYHHCQAILDGELGDPSGCTICVAAPDAVKASWFATICTCKCTLGSGLWSGYDSSCDTPAAYTWCNRLPLLIEVVGSLSG